MASRFNRIFGGEGTPKVFQTFNSLLGSIVRKRNATIVGPSKQLVGEFPEVDFERLYQYYHHWPHVKTALDVMHQKLRGSGIEIKTNNEYFNVFIEKWWDIANAEKKISQFIYSFLITGSAILELQYTPDGRLGNIEQIPMQTIYRVFRDQYGNELKLVQVVDGVFKELDPQYFIHHTINNPDRQAFGKSMFHTIASPRPIAGTVDPFTGEPINPSRNSIPLLDAQAKVQNDQVEIVHKMSKPRLIVGANGMPKDQMEQIQKEMADPNNDQYIWIFDKPIQSAELQIQAQGKFEDYTTNIDSMLDIALVFASNVIKNPQGFSYSGGQTPFDVLDQRMADMQGELIEIIKDRLLKPIAESWGFIDFDAMEVKISFVPTMKRLTMEDIHALDPEVVSKKERRELLKKLNISLDDQLWEEEQNEAKQDKSDQKNIQMQAALTGGMNPQDGKPLVGGGEEDGKPFDGKFTDDDKKDGGDAKGSVKAPKAPTTKPQNPQDSDRPKPTTSYKTPQPDNKKPRGESLVDRLIKEIANENEVGVKDKIELIKALERIPLPPKAGDNSNSSSDLYVSQGLDDEPDKPEITDPAVRKEFGLDKDENELPPSAPSKMARAGDTPSLQPSDNSGGRFTNTNGQGIPQIPVVSEEEYRKHLQMNTKGDAYQGGTGDDGINEDSDGTFKDPIDAKGDMSRTPETGNTALKNPHPRPNQPPMVDDEIIDTPNEMQFNDSGGSKATPDNTQKQILGGNKNDEQPIVPSEGFEPDYDEEELKKKIDRQNIGEADEEKPRNRDLKVGEDPMTTGIMQEDDNETQKQQVRLDDHPLQDPSANKGNINGINPRDNYNNTTEENPATLNNDPQMETGDLTPPNDKTSPAVGDSSQVRLQQEEQTGLPQDPLNPVDGIMDNSGLNVNPDEQKYPAVTYDDYMKKVQDGSNPLEQEGEPFQDGMIMKPQDVQQNDGAPHNDPTISGIDEEQVDPNILHQDPVTGRNYTDLTDEQGNPVPDLRWDQTPDSTEEQPQVELEYEIVTQDEYEAHLNKAQGVVSNMNQDQFNAELENPDASKPNPFDLDNDLDPVEKDETGAPKPLQVEDSQDEAQPSPSKSDTSKPNINQSKDNVTGKNETGGKISQKSDSQKSETKPKKKQSSKTKPKEKSKYRPSEEDVKDLPETGGDVEEIIKREHDLIEKGVPEDEVHDILLEEFGDKANDYKKKDDNK